ncbi:anaphase-promoting complex, cyclosome, subunit 4-domain-containing protein [Boletus edulis BED1]|uniref:Anaphase-promoting complex subunit 4 n=1 Tax=Boletus edulis BED1 TaxID=1328754 RepID=A0AAD4C198_BOLED|nr:anaphase-promoting complex, cyclosome, subunit 4-domain-containing protein [Boletus edulis BED1]
MSESNAFASLATLRLPSPCRLLSSACCPDKDLIVLISRLGGHDKLSLWKLQGSKKWEVDVGEDNDASATVADLVWSPSGQTIAVVRDSAHITLHSVQDGRIERCLSIPFQGTPETNKTIVGVWWFAGHHSPASGVIPDIFKRNGVKTGSALSILKTLPLLDHLKENGENMTATDLFAFQGTQTRTTSQRSMPAVIKQWPALVQSLEDASIAFPSQTRGAHDKMEESNSSTQAQEDEDSLLTLIDKRGALHCFLDGSYFLGSVVLPGGLPSATAFKHPRKPLIFLHPQSIDSDMLLTGMQPLVIDIPLLATPKVRDFARLSSAARELTWYIMRVVNEVREGWFGSESFTGARDIGIKWVQALERRLREQYGHLTTLLLTGSGSEGLTDFITSSEQNSERNLQKWDSSVTESLTRTRDHATARIIPALQRLHIILDEILGWSYMPQFMLFGLGADYVDSCLRMIERGIFISSWLAAEARRELGAFKQFLSFIRHETIVANPSTESHTNPDHDILEVNGYLISGLMASKIDEWFTGSLPQFNPGDLSYFRPPQSPGKALNEVLELARAALQDPSQTSWQPKVPSKDFSDLDKNLDALVQEIASRCQRIFAEASQAGARSATMSVDGGATPPQPKPVLTEGACHLVRQRVVGNQNEPDHHLQYLAVHVSSEGQTYLCMSRMPYGRYVAGIHDDIQFSLLGCCVGEFGGERSEIDVLDMEFFDEETLILVYQAKKGQGAIFVATVNYTTLGYQSERYVSGPARIDMMASVLQRRKEGHVSLVFFAMFLWRLCGVFTDGMGQVPCSPIPITKCRRLSGWRSGSVSLAVNGRVGRRVVCVLDGEGTTMEVLDMEGEELEGEEESEMEVVGTWP